MGPYTDVEVAPTDPRCHKKLSVTDTLTLSNGTVSIRLNGARLCLGEVGTTTRTFHVVGGTGAFARATGRGHAPISIQPIGATEHWNGVIHLHG